MSIYEELGLIQAHDEGQDVLNYPGPQWGEFTRPFGRDSFSVRMLGGVAATILVETRKAGTTFNANLERFAEAARPQILGALRTEFIEAGVEVASPQELGYPTSLNQETLAELDISLAQDQP
jgi:hypothetical protein